MSDNFFCAAPWRGLHINPRGDVKTCCAGDPNMLGNLNQQSITDILFSPKLQEIRQSLRQGRAHEYCYNCVQAERYGRSERDWHNNVSPKFDPKQAGDLEHLPTLIDVRWNTTCNLSCNYCGEACSSRWASIKGIPVKSGTRPYLEQVCDYLSKHKSSIREVALVGGEPLLLPDNELLLDVIPNDCTVTLITNASVSLSRNRIFEKLSNRSRVGWSLSFDNIGSKFEYVRHGSSWPVLVDNLDFIQALMKNRGHWGGIHAVYNIYNSTCLKELTEFARSRDLSIQWQSLYNPEFLDPFKLGAEIKQQALNEIKNLLDLNICLPNEATFFQNVLMQQSQTYENLKESFKQHIRHIENRYHPDSKDKFKKLWPEIYELI